VSYERVGYLGERGRTERGDAVQVELDGRQDLVERLVVVVVADQDLIELAERFAVHAASRSMCVRGYRLHGREARLRRRVRGMNRAWRFGREGVTRWSVRGLRAVTG